MFYYVNNFISHTFHLILYYVVSTLLKLFVNIVLNEALYCIIGKHKIYLAIILFVDVWHYFYFMFLSLMA